MSWPLANEKCLDSGWHSGSTLYVAVALLLLPFVWQHCESCHEPRVTCGSIAPWPLVAGAVRAILIFFSSNWRRVNFNSVLHSKPVVFLSSMKPSAGPGSRRCKFRTHTHNNCRKYANLEKGIRKRRNGYLRRSEPVAPPFPLPPLLASEKGLRGGAGSVYKTPKFWVEGSSY